jgi:hypothetical protein
VVREDLGPFCNTEGLFTGAMAHGCPLVTGYDYLAAQAPRESRGRASLGEIRVASPVVVAGVRDRQLLLTEVP